MCFTHFATDRSRAIRSLQLIMTLQLDLYHVIIKPLQSMKQHFGEWIRPRPQLKRGEDVSLHWVHYKQLTSGLLPLLDTTYMDCGVLFRGWPVQLGFDSSSSGSTAVQQYSSISSSSSSSSSTAAAAVQQYNSNTAAAAAAAAAVQQ